ncbi:RNA polymerase sigma factor [Candidatus Binatus sp.]|uniref:RNA polymerase sigma factor n=1 Tax=Candidatus Binatus sp. TaxID=2811406 RepID=UPI0027297B68|nr:sigma-70 family RNA polymerase sigma factor [Candidatus Binatus sp.]
MAPPEFAARYARALARLYNQSRAERWNVTQDLLFEAAHRATRSAGASGDLAIAALLDALHGEDLALALACKAGHAGAWEHVITKLRPSLYSAARAITRDDDRGRELADSLWADLYGLQVRDGARRSMLDYFHGRSSILTWLRAVLAQRHVDYVRSTSRLEQFADGANPPADASRDDDQSEPERARYVQMLGAALAIALKLLAPRERMRLGYYYRHALSLNEIGRLMNEHESTVSRQLARSRDALKREIEAQLKTQNGLDQEQIRLCYDYAAGDLPIDLGRALPEAR